MHMKRKRLFIVLLLCIASGALGARPLSTASLNVVGGYAYDGSDDYFAGMGSFEHWHIGGGLSARFSLLTADIMFLPSGYSDDENKLGIMMMPGLSIPLSVVSNLEIGFGPSIGLLIPKTSTTDSKFQYEMADGSIRESGTSFSTLFMQSTLYWKVAISAQLGDFGFHVGYLSPTELSLETIKDIQPSSFFLSEGGMLMLALSLDIY